MNTFLDDLDPFSVQMALTYFRSRFDDLDPFADWQWHSHHHLMCMAYVTVTLTHLFDLDIIVVFKDVDPIIFFQY